jgi:hypothetical protein
LTCSLFLTYSSSLFGVSSKSFIIGVWWHHMMKGRWLMVIFSFCLKPSLLH